MNRMIRQTKGECRFDRYFLARILNINFNLFKNQGRNRPATVPCFEIPERPLPGTLVKPSELPCILSPAHLLDAKLRLEKKLKALDEEDRKMEENEKRKTREKEEREDTLTI